MSTTPASATSEPAWNELTAVLSTGRFPVDHNLPDRHNLTSGEKVALAQQFINHYQLLPGSPDQELLTRMEHLIASRDGNTFLSSLPEYEDELARRTDSDYEPLTLVYECIHPVTDELTALYVHEQRLYITSAAYGHSYQQTPLQPASNQPAWEDSREVLNYQVLPYRDQEKLNELAQQWAERHFPDGPLAEPVGATLVVRWGSTEPTTHGPATTTQLWQDDLTGEHYELLLSRSLTETETSSWKPVTLAPFDTTPRVVFNPCEPENIPGS